jgi:hypothetical protein
LAFYAVRPLGLSGTPEASGIAAKGLAFALNDHPLRTWTMKPTAARQISPGCS